MRVQEELAIREKAYRKAKGITQRELAKLSNVSYASIRRFEATGEIALWALLSIASALGCLEDFSAVFKGPVYNSIEDVINATR